MLYKWIDPDAEWFDYKDEDEVSSNILSSIKIHLDEIGINSSRRLELETRDIFVRNIVSIMESMEWAYRNAR
jgi:hypothetical protein